MKLKTIITEICNSGIIPLICGSYILLSEFSKDTPNFIWGGIAVIMMAGGLILGDRYMNKPSRDTHDKENE